MCVRCAISPFMCVRCAIYLCVRCAIYLCARYDWKLVEIDFVVVATSLRCSTVRFAKRRALFPCA